MVERNYVQIILSADTNARALACAGPQVFFGFAQNHWLYACNDGRRQDYLEVLWRRIVV